MIRAELQRPWLIARLDRPMRLLSHAPFGAGYVTGQTVLWREVRNADLPQDFDAEAWIPAEMARAPAQGEVGLLTSRDVSSWRQAAAEAEGAGAEALVTLGLSNAEAVGTRLPWHSADFGTVNILVACSVPLTEAAQLEALTIAVQARTAAIIDLGLELSSGRATGTGTDCIVLACPAGAGRYAGLHTAAGEVVGRAVREAVSLAGSDWLGWREAALAARSACQSA